MMPDLNDDILDLYDYGGDPLLTRALHPRDAAAHAAMHNYGGAFGAQLVAHQARVADDTANFLRYLGYSEIAARNVRAALTHHDWGKIDAGYDPALWQLTARPTPEQKAVQKRHTRLGAAMLDTLAAEIEGLGVHPHFAARRALTLYHHERWDSRGPEAIDARTLPVFVQAACIADAYDGDLIPRPHQQEQRTPQMELKRLQGAIDDKYIGAFDPALIAHYVSMKEAELASG